jgi:hypothetical protein
LGRGDFWLRQELAVLVAAEELSDVVLAKDAGPRVLFDEPIHEQAKVQVGDVIADPGRAEELSCLHVTVRRRAFGLLELEA